MGVTLACLAAVLAVVSGQWTVDSPQPVTGVELPTAHCPLPTDHGQIKLGEEPANPEKEKAAAVARAKAHLSKKLGVPAGRLVLESATAATWPDAALGCPEKDRMYAQVVTDGYKVLLKHDGKTHEVHVSRGRAVLCAPPTR